MLIWTLAFVGVVATAALLGGTASWEGILLVARIGLVVSVALLLLAGARSLVRRMVRPWEHAASRPRLSAPRPYRHIGQVLDQAARKREERLPRAFETRAPRVSGDGRVR
jgi:hypothetical protein